MFQKLVEVFDLLISNIIFLVFYLNYGTHNRRNKRRTEDFYPNRKREMMEFQYDKQILNSGLNKKRG